jgi:hypothetical protein
MEKAFIDWLIHKAVSVYVGLGKGIITVLSHVICHDRWFFSKFAGPICAHFRK